MTAPEAIPQWDAEAVIAAARDLIHTSNYEKVSEARQNVDNTVAAWVRVATTDAAALNDPRLHHQAAVAITRLWSLYAALEIELRQFKQATKVFESGVSCPIAMRVPTVWLQYAEFCIERKKFSNARKVFVRAVHTIADVEHTELWTRFHAFVNEHLDPTMSMEALRAQVLPDGPVVPPAVTVPTPTPTPAAPTPTPPTAPAPTAPQQPQAIASGTPVMAQEAVAVPPASVVDPTPVASDVAPVATVVDPALAFVDTKGDAEPVAAVAVTGVKRKAPDTAMVTPVKEAKIEVEVDDKSFLEIPTTLPITPGCPHLLFDHMETQRSIDNELVEKLSSVLSDSAVFQGVKDLYENQRNRDRDMLYRWQDLVAMQMKEGSELFARHMDIETTITEPATLIEVKNKHIEQKREFTNRCRMSQHQFIEICEMDRVGALTAQQISLENMKIPEMCVTTDPDVIDLQRAIVGLILEADKLSREVKAKKAPEPARQSVRKAAPGFSAKQPFRPRTDSRDHDGGRGGRGGRGFGGNFSRGGGSFGRGGGARRPYSPPRGGRGGPPKRHDSYESRHVPPARTYDEPPARQVTYTHQGDGRSRSQTTAPYTPGANYGDIQSRDRYDRGPDRRSMQPHQAQHPPQQFAPPPRRFGDGPGGRGGHAPDPRYVPQDVYRGRSAQVGGQADPGSYARGYDRGNHYGAPAQQSAYAGRPTSRYGGETVGPPQQYSTAPAPISYEYPPPTSAVAYGYNTQPPRQLHPPQRVQYGQPPVHQQPTTQHHHQQLHAPQRAYAAPAPAPYHPPPLQHQPLPQQHRQPYQGSPPRGGGRGGYDRFRRGGGSGGGGGRYGRR